MEESDAHTHVLDGLAVKFDDETHHSVGRGVGRPEVDDDGLVTSLGSLGDDLLPVTALGQVLLGRNVLTHQL